LKVLLDTNALMVPEQFRVDIFSELERHGYLEFLVPRAVAEELEAVSRNAKRGRDKVAAKVALGLIKGCQMVEGRGDADSVLLELALDQGAAVFTNDKLLKKRLLSRGITVVYLRQCRYLDIAMRKEF